MFSIVEDIPVNEELKVQSNRVMSYLMREGVAFVLNSFFSLNQCLFDLSLLDFKYIKVKQRHIENLKGEYSLNTLLTLLEFLKNVGVKVIIDDIEELEQFSQLQAVDGILIKGSVIGRAESIDDFKILS